MQGDEPEGEHPGRLKERCDRLPKPTEAVEETVDHDKAGERDPEHPDLALAGEQGGGWARTARRGVSYESQHHPTMRPAMAGR